MLINIGLIVKPLAEKLNLASMRRQRTSSNRNEDANEELNDEIGKETENYNETGNDKNDEDEEMPGNTADNNSNTEYSEVDDDDTEMGSESDDDDSDDDDDDEEDDDEDDSEDYSDEDEFHFTNEEDYVEQIQAALMRAASGAGGPLDASTISQFILGNFHGSSTHSSRIKTIIRSLPTEPESTNPMLLYSAFLELWELLVFTGTEVEPHEFAALVDVNRLSGHLLRVLRWDSDCQVYGSEFLLFAVRCTWTCIQYSMPPVAQKFIDLGAAPLIVNHLLSAEYIDLAEDLIQTLLVLAQQGPRPAKACLHADGIRAVLGFVDFFSLSVQIKAFQAASAMASAISDETLPLYLPPDILALLRNTLKRFKDAESDAQTIKLVKCAAQTLSNALKSAKSHSVSSVFDPEFVENFIFPSVKVMPAESAALVSAIISSSHLAPELKKPFLIFLQDLLTNNESLAFDVVFKLVVPYAPRHLQSLSKTLNPSRNESQEFDSEFAASLSNVLFGFCVDSSGSNQSTQCLLTLTILDSLSQNRQHHLNLSKIGFISKLFPKADDCVNNLDILHVLCLEWCLVLCEKQKKSFSSLALRQGIQSQLQSLNSCNLKATNLHMNEWFVDRLESLGVTVFIGDENDSHQIYIRTVTKTLMSSISECDKALVDYSNVIASASNLKEFVELIKRESFTEFEWLGSGNYDGSERCLAAKLIELLEKGEQFDSLEDSESVSKDIYRALELFSRDSFKASTNNNNNNKNAHVVNDLETSYFMNRPMRILIRSSQNDSEPRDRLVSCHPFSPICWLVSLATASETERRLILKESPIVRGPDDDDENYFRIYDALDRSALSPSGRVDFSSKAFEASKIKVSLKASGPNFSIPEISIERPAQSLIEILWQNVPVKTSKDFRFAELWTLSVTISLKGDFVNPQLVDQNDKETVETFGPPVELAFKALSLLPSKLTSSDFTTKLSKELLNSNLIALGGISSHWLQLARRYPFLFPFELRVQLMRTVFFDRIRVKSTTSAQSNPQNTQLIQNNPLQIAHLLPKRKFKIYRDQILECLKNIFSMEQSGDFRAFEFEYADELGSGHGPTMEFYALALECLCRPSLKLFHVTSPGNIDADAIVEVEGEGLFPEWATDEGRAEEFQLLGSVVARALIDGRIIHLPLNPAFIAYLLQARNLDFEDLKLIDAQIYRSLMSTNLVEVDNLSIQDYRQELMKRINSAASEAKKNFILGFDSNFPVKFSQATSLFTPFDLQRLFTSDFLASDWSIDTIRSALLADHGYTPASPQITWLAEIIAETTVPRDRIKLIRFLTGAAYLPIGGWRALRPALTIVCKSDASGEKNSEKAVFNSNDAYLPSVMTCANYLKLPRYSSKAVMKERFQYAILEASESFFLS